MPTLEATWGKRAACEGQEMVLDHPPAIGRAKRLCAVCPLADDCLATARRISETEGVTGPAGVWGGLTERERATWALLGREPEPCRRCGQRCVPIRLNSRVCSVCAPRQQISMTDYRPLIERLLADGAGVGVVAERLGMTYANVNNACRRWKLTRPRGRKRNRVVMECGTLAAKERHRKHGEDWRKCACRSVAWKRGVSRKKDVVNT